MRLAGKNRLPMPDCWHSGSDSSLAYRCGGSTGLIKAFGL
ncbi:hypothetical protein C4K38_3963 [Pseudomonas chlororaphis subsp. piscium]|uniref:Uncharacterized protein n=1 Tax=Pseudomonas chlororaphis subsp. aureofaciens TaxID=587851 RepID=A0AAD0ZER6_9PSED|nr:hypothetical protein C4K38_3963 [Pseudomonas chlororaphis subsp. piscium]AZE05903.1 hypothetical protein C4K11_3744 [Pseudomonas chlororaphis subsp. aureofaciens]AZE18105.1 hypothetical protein C4K09_3647 [Pseudomonas chlororaphis subsp. aureofaciens]AZE24306.1 hypothetical protein C4K08_3882 [Pseudomonas chlororaphis subsp. aureofaciens]AZE30596.1 hypothetical protein C4K07_3814 [Pseudomonas chlororaphis subsp. aureofaciens]